MLQYLVVFLSQCDFCATMVIRDNTCEARGYRTADILPQNCIPFFLLVTLLLLPKIVNYHLPMKLIANALLHKRISLAFPDVLKT